MNTTKKYQYNTITTTPIFRKSSLKKIWRSRIFKMDAIYYNKLHIQNKIELY